MENIKRNRISKAQSYPLPTYSRGEENMNFITHTVGVGIGFAVLISCIIKSAVRSNVIGAVGSLVYGISMIALYLVSSVYHGLRNERAKKVFRVIDHCTIYFLIAGTYTPILLGAVRTVSPVKAYSLLGMEWGLAVIAIIFTAIDMKKFTVPSMICYLFLGWGIMFIVKTTVEAVTVAGFVWLLCGGIVYTLGSVLYGLGKKMKYMHSVFHIFCLVGSLLQFVCVIGYCL